MVEQNKKKPQEGFGQSEGCENTHEGQECNGDTKKGQEDILEKEIEIVGMGVFKNGKCITEFVGIKDKDYGKIQDEFASWVAVPEEIREELGLPTQAVFAEKYGVDRNTLGLWKHNPEFWEKVKLVRGYWLKEQTTSIMKALVKKARREGSAPEVKLFMQIVEDFQEKNQVQVMPLSGVLAEIKESDKNIINQRIKQPDEEKFVIRGDKEPNQEVSGGQGMEAESSLLDKR